MEKVEKEILERYFRGDPDEKIRQKVIEYFTDKRYYTSLKKVWADHFNEVLDREELESPDLSSVLDKVHHELNIRANRKRKQQIHLRVLHFLMRVAAVLFVPLLAFTVWHASGHHAPVGAVTMAELVAPRGGRIQFTLPDGTHGWLNAQSTLRYPTSFRGKERKVSLSGEGYFEVAHDKRHPFIVNAEKVEVKVLGTQFDISAYPDDDVAEITLVKGKVEVYGKKDEHWKTLLSSLSPGEQIVIRKVDLKYRKQKVENPQYYAAWKEGKLIFRNDPMTEVVKKLGRWYNVEFLLQEKNLEEYRYHATFQYESLDEVLKLIKLTSPVDYRIIKRKKLPDGSFSKKKIILFAKKEFAKKEYERI